MQPLKISLTILITIITTHLPAQTTYKSKITKVSEWRTIKDGWVQKEEIKQNTLVIVSKDEKTITIQAPINKTVFNVYWKNKVKINSYYRATLLSGEKFSFIMDCTQHKMLVMANDVKNKSISIIYTIDEIIK